MNELTEQRKEQQVAPPPAADQSYGLLRLFVCVAVLAVALTIARNVSANLVAPILAAGVGAGLLVIATQRRRLPFVASVTTYTCIGLLVGGSTCHWPFAQEAGRVMLIAYFVLIMGLIVLVVMERDLLTVSLYAACALIGALLVVFLWPDDDSLGIPSSIVLGPIGSLAGWALASFPLAVAQRTSKDAPTRDASQ